eukprot:3725099-Rhodomonas_salina.2
MTRINTTPRIQTSKPLFKFSSTQEATQEGKNRRVTVSVRNENQKLAEFWLGFGRLVLRVRGAVKVEDSLAVASEASSGGAIARMKIDVHE